MRVADVFEMAYVKTRLQYCVITYGYLDVRLWTNISETVLYITRLYYFFVMVADDRL
jgi:hypothetical protein